MIVVNESLERNELPSESSTICFSPTAKERELGYFESYAASVPSCVVSMVCVLSDGGRLNESAFRHSVDAVARRHPNLRSLLISRRVDNSEKKMSFRLMDNFCLDISHVDIIDVSSPSSALCDDGKDSWWQSVVEKESNIGFDLDGVVPYWRVVLIKGSTNDVLLTKYHHCVGDGTSGYILIHDILKFHQLSLSSSESAQPIADAELGILPVLPSIDAMCLPNGRSEEDEIYVKESLKILQAKRSNWYPRLKFAKGAPVANTHSILYHDGTEEGLSGLLKQCREIGVTIGAVLGAATFFAVAKMNGGINPNVGSDEVESSQPFYFDFDMDVNLRKRLPTSLGDDHVGAYIGMMSFNLSLDPTTKFWDFVRTMHKAIQKGLDENQHIHYLEVNQRFDKIMAAGNAFVQEKAWKEDDGHVQDMNFSNIGRYPFPPKYGGSINIEKIYCVGGGWVPTFGGYVLLIPSVRYLNFSLVYESAETNHVIARELFSYVCDLTEHAVNFSNSFTLKEYMEQ